MKAFERIAAKQQQITYKKVGKKYVPQNDPFAYDGLREGWHLIKIDKGCTSIRSCVYPSNVELIAAARDKQDKIMDIIRAASEAKPKEGVPLSAEARSDWQWFIGKHGKEFSTLYYPSFYDNAEKIMNAILEK